MSKFQVGDTVIGLQLSNHGGMCCGVKTIWNLGTDPETLQPELEKENSNRDDVHFLCHPPTKRFFTDTAPEEKAFERLDRMIAFLKKRRPQHLVEVVITPSSYYCSQGKWVPILEERGFQEVTSWVNSNSENTCVLYHLILDEPEGDD